MIKAIIIDDEAGARTTLHSFVSNFCEDIEIVATCENVPDGVIAINKYQPDLVFLDIEMPEYNGFELFKFFNEITFEIIFVTAYHQYAIKAFEVSAIDYLLKPVDIEQLQLAIKKVQHKKEFETLHERLQLMADVAKGETFKRIALPMSEGLVFIEISDIVLFIAEGAYTNVYLNNGTKIMVSKPVRVFDQMLEGKQQFYRCHRSFLINLNYIKKYLKGESIIHFDNGEVAQVARDRKADFEGILKAKGISL